jgi:hypothetical protein
MRAQKSMKVDRKTIVTGDQSIEYKEKGCERA